MFPKPSYVCCSFRSPLQSSEDGDSSGWRGFLSSMGLSIPATLCRLSPAGLHLNQRRMIQGKAPDIPEHVLRLAGVGPDKLRAEWTFPAFITMFLPEFPHKAVPGHEHFQVKLTPTQNWQTTKLCLTYFHTHVSVSDTFWLLSLVPPLCLCSVLCSKTFQVLSYIAKGSFGPILKVKDKARQKTYAVKVSLPPSIVLQNTIIVIIATAF